MTPFEEILRRRMRQRQPMDERLPDGRTVDDLLESVRTAPSTAQPQPPVLTQQNQQAITRPRTVQQQPSQATPADGATRARAVTFNPASGRPNEDYYRERGDSAGLYNAYQNWSPHGGKRGFKSALKAGALTAARAAQATDNPAAILAAFGAGAAGGAVKPDFKNKLVRGFKLDQLGGEVGNQLKLQREQANIDAAQMVPITLENGEQVLVPAKSAGTLRSHQQEIGLRGDTLEARKKRWNQLGEHEAATEAQQLYNSGAADDDAELRAEIAKRLRLPAGTALPPRGSGNQVKLDEAGNYVVINPRTGAVTDTGTQSYETTKEAGRDTRQNQALKAARERVQMQQSGATQRTQIQQEGQDRRKRTSPANQMRIADRMGKIEGIKSDLTSIDAQIKKLDDETRGRQPTAEEKKKIESYGRTRAGLVSEAKAAATELNILDADNETGVGEGGYPYRKPRVTAAPQQSGGQYAGRRISKANVAEYGRRHGMTPAQADEFLRKEGAVIY